MSSSRSSLPCPQELYSRNSISGNLSKQESRVMPSEVITQHKSPLQKIAPSSLQARHALSQNTLNKTELHQHDYPSIRYSELLPLRHSAQTIDCFLQAMKLCVWELLYLKRDSPLNCRSPGLPSPCKSFQQWFSLSLLLWIAFQVLSFMHVVCIHRCQESFSLSVCCGSGTSLAILRRALERAPFRPEGQARHLSPWGQRTHKVAGNPWREAQDSILSLSCPVCHSIHLFHCTRFADQEVGIPTSRVLCVSHAKSICPADSVLEAIITAMFTSEPARQQPLFTYSGLHF